MIYTTKEECYEDVLISLTSGILLVEDLRFLQDHYEEIEHYECCQGIAEAYADYEKLKKAVNDYEIEQLQGHSEGDSVKDRR